MHRVRRDSQSRKNTKARDSSAGRVPAYALGRFGGGHEHQRFLFAAEMNQELDTRLRILIARQLGVDVGRVSDESLFLQDLGADWLDRHELVIAVEDQFGIQIADSVVDELNAVGDLILFVLDYPRH